MYDDALFVLKKDKKLKKIILSVGECKIKTISNPFEALVKLTFNKLSNSVYLFI